MFLFLPNHLHRMQQQQQQTLQQRQQQVPVTWLLAEVLMQISKQQQ
jgi:hypothetical protein